MLLEGDGKDLALRWEGSRLGSWGLQGSQGQQAEGCWTEIGHLSMYRDGRMMGRRKERGRSGKPKKGFKWRAGHGRYLWKEEMELAKVRIWAALSQW